MGSILGYAQCKKPLVTFIISQTAVLLPKTLINIFTVMNKFESAGVLVKSSLVLSDNVYETFTGKG
jgi:hypothetical protein